MYRTSHVSIKWMAWRVCVLRALSKSFFFPSDCWKKVGCFRRPFRSSDTGVQTMRSSTVQVSVRRSVQCVHVQLTCNIRYVVYGLPLGLLPDVPAIIFLQMYATLYAYNMNRRPARCGRASAHKGRKRLDSKITRAQKDSGT